MSTRDEPERNSRMMTSRVFWSMSPCVADTVWSRSRIFSVSQSTCRQGQGGQVGGVVAARGTAGPPVDHPPRHARRCMASDCHCGASVPCLAPHLAARVGKDDRLGDGERLVQVAQRVELPLLLLHVDVELRARAATRGGKCAPVAPLALGSPRGRALAPALGTHGSARAPRGAPGGPPLGARSARSVHSAARAAHLLDTLERELVALDQNAHGLVHELARDLERLGGQRGAEHAHLHTRTHARTPPRVRWMDPQRRARKPAGCGPMLRRFHQKTLTTSRSPAAWAAEAGRCRRSGP